MKKRLMFGLIGVFIISFIFMPITTNASEGRVSRISGKDRYFTSVEMGKSFGEDNKINSVILVDGKKYPDALTASILSKKNNGPIILIDTQNHREAEQLGFIQENLDKEGTVYLVGGQNNLDYWLVEYFEFWEYKNIKTIAGYDRYDTNCKIVREANVKEGTPIILANSESFADALSVSAISTVKEYPIFLTKEDSIPVNILEEIIRIKPTKVYIAGGEKAVSSNVENEIKKQLSYIENDSVVRLSGNDRYETSMKILNYFKGEFNKENILIASGEKFPDALSGSALAGKINAPILLTNSQSIVDNKDKLDEYKNVKLLGGVFSVEEYTERRLNQENKFSFRFDSAYEKDGKKYVVGNFNKLSDDVKEVEAYCRYYGIPCGVVYIEGEEPTIWDLGQDIPISTKVEVEVNDDTEIKVIDWEKEDLLNDRKNINFEEFKTRTGWTGHPIISLEFENNKLLRIKQEYRP
ncbi:MAG: cell wall-binding repeat-containing protein [Clostridium sp.]